MENWLLLFGSERHGVERVTYSVGKGSWKQLLLGLVPGATYRLSIDGVDKGLLLATNKGCLQFRSEGAGSYDVFRTTDSQAPLPPDDIVNDGGGPTPDDPTDLPPAPEDPDDEHTVDTGSDAILPPDDFRPPNGPDLTPTGLPAGAG